MQKLQCTVCGGGMTMDISGEFAKCDYCDMKFDKRIIKQMIDGIQGYDDLVKNAEVFLNLTDYSKAQTIFTEITNKYPDRTRGWWGLFECETQGLVLLDRLTFAQVYYDRALKFASDDEKTQIMPLYDNYIIKQNALNLKRKQEQDLAAERQTNLNNLNSILYNLNNGLRNMHMTRFPAKTLVFSIISIVAGFFLYLNASTILNNIMQLFNIDDRIIRILFIGLLIAVGIVFIVCTLHWFIKLILYIFKRNKRANLIGQIIIIEQQIKNLKI